MNVNSEIVIPFRPRIRGINMVEVSVDENKIGVSLHPNR